MAVASLALMVSACTPGADRVAADVEATELATQIVSRLCEAASLAENDRDGAIGLFDEAHDRLHTFLDDLLIPDRTQAQGIMEAKALVEADVGVGSQSEDRLGDDLESLARIVVLAGQPGSPELLPCGD